ncbi:MAG: exodeoxyribonuclease VII small subunit [Patescibacteria group bacterium]|jgi:exodeoxyribonuclease VII small subunit
MPKEKKFAELFKELEEITKKFEERSNEDLDTSVKEFERGLEIAQELKARLQDIELKVKKIQAKYEHKES